MQQNRPILFESRTRVSNPCNWQSHSISESDIEGVNYDIDVAVRFRSQCVVCGLRGRKPEEWYDTILSNLGEVTREQIGVFGKCLMEVHFFRRRSHKLPKRGVFGVYIDTDIQQKHSTSSLKYKAIVKEVFRYY
jgi:hypothetical protein